MRVLIIDDDDGVRSLLRELFEGNGFETREAENGEIGLRLFDEFAPEVVITDIVMPDREGISTIMELRKKKVDVRIFAMSGNSIRSSSYLDWARKLGADGIFEKPLDLESLLLAVRAGSENR